MNRKTIEELFAVSIRNWQADSIPVRAAALTFFIVLPLPSLLLIVISIFAVFYGQSQALSLLVQQISAVVGPSVAELFRGLLTSATSPFISIWTAITVVIFSVGGAIGAFAVLRETMDAIWKFRAPKTRRITTRIRRWIGPFALVSALGLIVIASTPIATALFNEIERISMSGLVTLISLTTAKIIFSFVVSSILFAIIYKVIPEATVHWKDVILASLIAGAAFTVTNYIIGTYIETFTITTIIGTAGSLFIILLWIYILNQIVFFGAEISRVYALTFGKHSKKHLLKPIEQRQTST